MGLKVITPPVGEPVSLADQKLHMKVDSDAEDDLIEAQIAAARELVEAHISGRLITQTLEWTLRGFPSALDLPVQPVQSVASITYVDPAGVTQTLDPSLYLVDVTARPVRIVPAFGQRWPATRARHDAVTVRFVAGFGAAADVPAGINTAVKLIVTQLYEGRMGDAEGLPATALALLRSFRMRSV